MGAEAKLGALEAVLTWSAIYPLALVVPLVVVPALKALGAPSSQPLATLADRSVVFLMVYLVMPRYTSSCDDGFSS